MAQLDLSLHLQPRWRLLPWQGTAPPLTALPAQKVWQGCSNLLFTLLP